MSATGLNGGQGQAFVRVQNFVGSQSAGQDHLNLPVVLPSYTLTSATTGSLGTGQNYSGFALVNTPTKTSVTLAPNPSTYGDVVTLTAAISVPYPGASTPTGTVTFMEGGTTLATNVLVDGSGIAKVSTSKLAGGSHTITAAFTGTNGWLNSSGDNSASPLLVNQANQTITFAGPTSPITFAPNKTVTLSASASSGLPVTFSIDPSSTGSGSISGNVLTITGAGSFVIDANQAGNSNYNAAPQVQKTLVVTKAGQTITFTAPTSPITYAPNKTVTLSASASSGAVVTFSVDASSTGSGSISGKVLTITGAGTIVLDANQAGNSNYMCRGEL